MQSLEKLKSGEYKGCKALTLREELSEFPLEILTLKESLEFLDLSYNNISIIPPEVAKLTKLKTLFISYNQLTKVPAYFKECLELNMFGLKGNQIEVFEENILPLSISWLILTDNKLSTLPKSIGKLIKLRKFPLAGNQLTTLPKELGQCVNIELMRLSANQLNIIPKEVLQLPKLSWLAFSGNPCAKAPSKAKNEISYNDLTLSDTLGVGASGHIYKAYSKQYKQEVAAKIFKGEITSDGYARDEIAAYMSTGTHENLIKVLAQIKEKEHLGLILELIPKTYINLGNPPSFTTCTRDTFESTLTLDISTITKILKDILSAITHLHAQGIMHGDLYAHNILVDYDKKHAYLGDFGAATFYDKKDSDFEKIEVRAFGCLCEDLLALCANQKDEKLQALVQACMQEDSSKRPLFKDIKQRFF